MSRLAKQRTCVRSKMPEPRRGHVLQQQLREHVDVGDVGQREDDGAARAQSRDRPGEHVLGVEEVLEHVAGEDGVEGLVAQVRGVELREVALDDAVEPLARLPRRAGVELDAHDFARAGLLEHRAVVPAAAAEVEHAQSARVDQLQKGRLGVAEVAGGHVHRRIIPRARAGPGGSDGSRGSAG